jgi:hypothetical protein
MAFRPSFALGATSITALLFTLSACSSGSDSDPSYVIRTANESVAASTQIAIAGNNLAFLAEEATSGAGGTDFNQDGDQLDAIAVALNFGSDSENVLNVATNKLAWIGNELYLVVDEAKDEVDWNVDADETDLVLLHWNATTPAVIDFVDEVTSTGLQMVAIGANLFYTSTTTPAGALQSNVNVISSATPLVPTMIPTQDLADDLSPRIVFEDEGLIFLALDETVEGRDVNDDVDATDTAVLALLDGTGVLGVIRNVELALSSDQGPFRARDSGTLDWDVGFLVSEAGQGGTNLNLPGSFAPSWQPTQCIGDEDSDTTDAILHYLEFAAWNANPVTSPPRNTGLVGKDKIAIANGFIATISQESLEGTCDLNGDADTADDVVRWTQIVADPSPILPLNTAANIRALFDVPGGTHGLAELGTRFVIVVNESDDDNDINGAGGETLNLVGWLLPSTVANAWDFTHSNTPTFVGTGWLNEQPNRSNLGVALEERVNGVNINSHLPAVPGEDVDTLDSVPTFPTFTSNTILSFPGVAIAADSDNAGVVVAGGFGFYRVSEAEDARDWNSDGDETDFVLWRTSLSQSVSTYMGSHNSLSRLSIFVNPAESPAGGAYIATENQEGVGGLDLNGDGDTNDLVLRYFDF